MANSLRGHNRGFRRRNEKRERWVFRRFLKSGSDGADVKFCARVFHSREAETRKTRSPMVERLVPRTTVDDEASLSMT